MRRSDGQPNSLRLGVEAETASRPFKRRCWAVVVILVPRALPGLQLVPMTIREEELNDRGRFTVSLGLRLARQPKPRWSINFVRTATVSFALRLARSPLGPPMRALDPRIAAS